MSHVHEKLGAEFEHEPRRTKCTRNWMSNWSWDLTATPFGPRLHVGAGDGVGRGRVGGLTKSAGWLIRMTPTPRHGTCSGGWSFRPRVRRLFWH